MLLQMALFRSFWRLSNIPLCVCITSLSISLGCSHVLAVVNSAPVNIGLCVSFWIIFLFLHCSPETITSLLVSYTPIQNEKFFKMRCVLPGPKCLPPSSTSFPPPFSSHFSSLPGSHTPLPPQTLTILTSEKIKIAHTYKPVDLVQSSFSVGSPLHSLNLHPHTWVSTGGETWIKALSLLPPPACQLPQDCLLPAPSAGPAATSVNLSPKIGFLFRAKGGWHQRMT